MEDLHIGRAASEARSESRRPIEDVVRDWRAAGDIDV